MSMEFISAEGLTRQSAKTMKMLHFTEEERPVAIQIYGADPERMAEAGAMVEAMGADVCDINMGCPANKVLRGCAGAALGGDLLLARQIVRAVRTRVRLPLTAKFRLGLRDGALTYLELGRLCQEEGADAVTLHARTARQQFSGAADWSHIARLKESLAIPVIGNGDVTTPEQAVRCHRATGCDGVMIGRASLVNPWIFRQTAALLHGERYAEPAVVERHRLIRDHFDAVLQREDERAALHKLRKFTGWYTHGLPEGRALRRRLSELDTASAVMNAVNAYFRDRSAA